MSQPFRLSRGGVIDRRHEISFRFDGKPYIGHPATRSPRP